MEIFQDFEDRLASKFSFQVDLEDKKGIRAPSF